MHIVVRFVLSEAMGCAEDMDYYRPGVVEFQSPMTGTDSHGEPVLDPELLLDFVVTVQFYLREVEQRTAIAATGRRLFERRTMADALKAAVHTLS